YGLLLVSAACYALNFTLHGIFTRSTIGSRSTSLNSSGSSCSSGWWDLRYIANRRDILLTYLRPAYTIACVRIGTLRVHSSSRLCFVRIIGGVAGLGAEAGR